MKTDARWMARRRSSRAVAVALATCGTLMTAALPSRAAEVDARTTLFVTNRDSSDVTMIDTSSDRIVGRIALGELVNPHMAMVTPDGKRLLVAGPGSASSFLVPTEGRRAVRRTLDRGMVVARAGLPDRLVPQQSVLTFPFRAEHVALMGRAPHLGRWRAPDSADHRSVGRAMALTDTESLAGRDVTTLSGGAVTSRSCR